MSKNNFIIIGMLSVLIILALFLIMKSSGDSIMNLHDKITSHSEMAEYKTESPRITYLSENFLSTLNTTFFEKAKAGDYLVEYVGVSALYRPTTDEILNVDKIIRLPEDFDEKLYSHEQISNFKDLNAEVLKISTQNIETLKQQLIGLDESYLGKYIVNYGTFILVYDYDNDTIDSIVPINTQEQGTVNELLTKLMAHSEMSDVQGQTPEGGQLNAETLAQLRESFPQIYNDAEVGDFVLRYEKKLVIYNFETDTIKKIFNVQQ